MSKQRVDLVVLGHAGAGKSTAIGHFIYMCGGVRMQAIEKYTKEATATGKSSPKYAWVLNVLQAERDKGVTTDVVLCQFETPKFCFSVTDVSKHRHFVENLSTGSTRADVAVLVVTAGLGEFEAGLVQAREHALLALGSGIKHIVVVVTKMETVSYSQERFIEVKTSLSDALAGFQNVQYVPISGWTGENMLDRTNLLWWDGPTLLEALDKSGALVF